MSDHLGPPTTSVALRSVLAAAIADDDRRALLLAVVRAGTGEPVDDGTRVIPFPSPREPLDDGPDAA